jgi:hypothetical protein
MGLAHFLRLFEQLRLPPRELAQRPPRESVRQVQTALSAALADPAFCLDCLESDIRLPPSSRSSADLVPFAGDAERGIRVALGYWGPGAAAGPHEHADWTVTAVFHNALMVQTYDHEHARRTGELAPRRVFGAAVGQAGHIYHPCLHDPRNPTGTWSISLHVVGPLHSPTLAMQGIQVRGVSTAAGDSTVGDSTDGDSTPSSDPVDRQLARIAADGARCAQVLALQRWPGDRARRLLEALFQAGSGPARRAAAAELAQRYGIDAWRASDLPPPRACALDTQLEHAWPGVELGVVAASGEVSLVARSRHRRCVLLRTGPRAARALEFVAAHPSFEVGALPGDLAAADKVRLAEALVEGTAFRVGGPAGGADREVETWNVS